MSISTNMAVGCIGVVLVGQHYFHPMRSLTLAQVGHPLMRHYQGKSDIFMMIVMRWVEPKWCAHPVGLIWGMCFLMGRLIPQGSVIV